MASNPWDTLLTHVRGHVDAEDYRRWFGPTAYASDSGDQITVWVPTVATRRHIESHFGRQIDGALETMGRAGTHIRFVVTGISEDDDEDESA